MKYKLSEVMDLIGGGTPKTTKAEYWNGDIPWLSVKDFNNDIRFVYSTEKTITELGLRNSSTKLLQRGDVIISARGTVGELATVPFPMAFNQSCYGLRANNEVLDEDYLYYLMKHNISALKKKTHGSVFDTITRDTFDEIDVDLPELAVQKKIALTLSKLDEKIELNNAINNNLEEQAQTIFRTYFIDYIPYGGKAPANWIYTTLGDVCIKVTDGSHYSPTDDESGIYPMYSVKDMETYGFNPSSCKHIGEDEFNKMLRNDCVPQVNDILVAKDGSYLKEIFICTDGNKEAILSSIAIFRPNTDIILPEILLYLLKQPSIRKDVGDNYVSGSALPRIVLKDFKKYSILLPSITEQKQIGEVLNSIRMQTHVNTEENRRLSLLRDTLLLKLMSGEIDVSSVSI